MRSPARLPVLLLAACSFTFGACDAGNRADPGAENTLGAPTVTISTPHEGQAVVRSRQGASVLAKFDLTGALGRNEGATLRYRLDAPGAEGTWIAVPDPQVAVALGDLKPTEGDAKYVLTVEVLDKAGAPYASTETTGEGAAAVTRTKNPSATSRRTFTVAEGWQ
jgi:hypothetical protein